jgi:hypothetical protein
MQVVLVGVPSTTRYGWTVGDGLVVAYPDHTQHRPRPDLTCPGADASAQRWPSATMSATTGRAQAAGRAGVAVAARFCWLVHLAYQPISFRVQKKTHLFHALASPYPSPLLWSIAVLSGKWRETNREWDKWMGCLFIAEISLYIHVYKGHLTLGSNNCRINGWMGLDHITLFCNTPPWSTQNRLIICNLSYLLKNPMGKIRSIQYLLDNENNLT